VKRWGKSPPVPVVTSEAVCLMGCKAMYIPNSNAARIALSHSDNNRDVVVSEGVGRSILLVTAGLDKW